MALFAIADLHLSLGSDKPMDVFEGWKNYTEKLAHNWRSIVGEEDTVVIAGDVSWAMKLEEAQKDFAYIHALPGKKLIIKGNHDYWWSTRKKIETFLTANGFHSIQIVHNNAVSVGNVAVCGSRGWLYNGETEEDKKIVNREVGRLNASIDEAVRLGKEPIVFLHYPPVYDVFQCDEILQVLKQRGIQKCYFGHIHGSQAAKRAVVGEYEGIKMHLISCDHVGFTPVLVR
ncbi:MAG TPA: serine/threonine protein phosphatase [Clostridiales bacterium]|nr:serine/threonine protein phosphatase [Clostridiales bacterium]